MKEFAKRINYFAATFMSLLGLTLIYEIISEDDHIDKIDDILILLIGLVSAWWYKKKGHLGKSPWGAVVIFGLAVTSKIFGIIVERGDKDALGDDIGIGITLILGLIFVTWQTIVHKKDSK